MASHPILDGPCLIQRGRTTALLTRLHHIPCPGSHPTGGPVIAKGETGPTNNALSHSPEVAGPAVAKQKIRISHGEVY